VAPRSWLVLIEDRGYHHLEIEPILKLAEALPAPTEDTPPDDEAVAWAEPAPGKAATLQLRRLTPARCLRC